MQRYKHESRTWKIGSNDPELCTARNKSLSPRQWLNLFCGVTSKKKTNSKRELETWKVDRWRCIDGLFPCQATEDVRVRDRLVSAQTQTHRHTTDTCDTQHDNYRGSNRELRTVYLLCWKWNTCVISNIVTFCLPSNFPLFYCIIHDFTRVTFTNITFESHPHSNG